MGIGVPYGKSRRPAWHIHTEAKRLYQPIGGGWLLLLWTKVPQVVDRARADRGGFADGPSRASRGRYVADLAQAGSGSCAGQSNSDQTREMEICDDRRNRQHFQRDDGGGGGVRHSQRYATEG